MRVRAKRALALILSICIIFAFPAVSFGLNLDSQVVPSALYPRKLNSSEWSFYLDEFKKLQPDFFPKVTSDKSFYYFIAVYPTTVNGTKLNTFIAHRLEYDRTDTSSWPIDFSSSHVNYFPESITLQPGHFDCELHIPLLLVGYINVNNLYETFNCYAIKTGFKLSDVFSSFWNNDVSFNSSTGNGWIINNSNVVQNDYYFSPDYVCRNVGLPFQNQSFNVENLSFSLLSFSRDKHFFYDQIKTSNNLLAFDCYFVNGSDIYNNSFTGYTRNTLSFDYNDMIAFLAPEPLQYNLPLNIDSESELDGHNPNGDTSEAVQNVENAFGGKDGGENNLNGGLQIMDDLIEGNQTAATALGGIFALINQIIAPLVGMVLLFAVCMFLIHKAGE